MSQKKLQWVIDFIIFILVFVTAVTLIEYNDGYWLLDAVGDVIGVLILIFYGQIAYQVQNCI